MICEYPWCVSLTRGEFLAALAVISVAAIAFDFLLYVMAKRKTKRSKR